MGLTAEDLQREKGKYQASTRVNAFKLLDDLILLALECSPDNGCFQVYRNIQWYGKDEGEWPTLAQVATMIQQEPDKTQAYLDRLVLLELVSRMDGDRYALAYKPFNP